MSKTSPNSENSSAPFYKLRNILSKISPPLIWAFCFIIFISGTLLWIAAKISSPQLSKTLHEIGVLGVTITPILFIYEGVLRRHLQEEMKREMKSAIDEAGIQKDILQIVKKTMPASYMNLIDSGVSDAFLNLDASLLIKRIEENKIIIKVNKIWMPYINSVIGIDVIIKSIEAGNSYKIVLCDYQLEEALTRRAKVISEGVHSAESYKNHIIENIRFFGKVWVELKKKGIENRLEFRLHNDFIATSLIGFDEYFLLGLYLNGKLATTGMQFKIDKDSITGSKFYNELDMHFNMQWENAFKEVQFDDINNKYKIIERAINKVSDEGVIF